MNETKEKILQGIQKAREKGYTLITEDWGDDLHKCGCALGCLLVANDVKLDSSYTSNFNKACEILNKDYNWVDSFIAGFDEGYLVYGQTPVEEAMSLGKELRKEFKPPMYHEFVDKLKKQGK